MHLVNSLLMMLSVNRKFIQLGFYERKRVILSGVLLEDFFKLRSGFFQATDRWLFQCTSYSLTDPSAHLLQHTQLCESLWTLKIIFSFFASPVPVMFFSSFAINSGTHGLKSNCCLYLRDTFFAADKKMWNSSRVGSHWIHFHRIKRTWIGTIFTCKIGLTYLPIPTMIVLRYTWSTLL